MTRVLQSVWEGHGAPPAEFPGRRDLSGQLTDDDIAFLVDNLTTDDPRFWRRIGRTLSLEQLSHLSLADPSVNLQRLVASNADRLTGKAMRLLHEPPRVDEADIPQVPRWLIARGCLTLRGEDWSLYIASNSVDQLPRAEQRDGIAVSRLRDRSVSQSVIIGQLELSSGDRVITYASRGMENVINDDRLLNLAESPDVLIHRATLVLRSGRRIVCDFTSLTALGHTSATFPLDELIGSAFALLKDIDDEDMRNTRVKLASGRAMGEPTSISCESEFCSEHDPQPIPRSATEPAFLYVALHFHAGLTVLSADGGAG
jgi:hypothetical protein